MPLKFSAPWVTQELHTADHEELSGKDSLRHLSAHDARWAEEPIQVACGAPEQDDRAGSILEARFHSLRAVALHPDGYVLVCDTGNKCVKALSVNMKEVQTLVTEKDGLEMPVGIAVCPQTKDVYITDAGRHAVFRRTASGQVSLFVGSPTKQEGYAESQGGGLKPAIWRSPAAVTVDLAGDLIVCDRGNHCIRKVEISKDATAPPTDLFAGAPGVAALEDGTPHHARFKEPCGICTLQDGTTFIADAGNRCLRQISADGKQVGKIGGPFQDPCAVEVDPCGRIYCCDAVQGKVYRVERTGQGSSTVLASIEGACGCALDAKAGLLFVCHGTRLSVVRVTPCLPFLDPASIDFLSDLIVQENAQESFTDVIFQVEGRQLHAHQCVLAVRSSKLKAILKRHGGGDEPINMDNVSYTAFLVTMMFLYTDRCIVDRETAPQVLQLADDLDISRLKRLVEEYLLKRLNEETCVSLFKLSHTAHAPRLKQAALRVMYRTPSLMDGLLGDGIPPDMLLEVLSALPNPDLLST
jgi:sugar lactone lactonase YvrE